MAWVIMHGHPLSAHVGWSRGKFLCLVATKPSGHTGQCQELMVVGEKEAFVRGIHTYTGGRQRSRCRNVVVRADSKLGELRGW